MNKKKPSPAERLTELTNAGAVIVLAYGPPPPSNEYTIADGLWREENGHTVLRWVVIDPQGQQDIHHTKYDDAQVKGSFVELYRGGKSVASIGPAHLFENIKNFDDQFRRHKDFLASGPDAVETWERFFHYA